MPLLQTIWRSFSWNGTDYTTTQAGTKTFKTDVLLIKYLLTVTVNQRMPLLHKQSVLESFSWNGTDYTTNQAGTRIASKMDVLLIPNLTVTP
jgi:hypothetical protein